MAKQQVGSGGYRVNSGRKPGPGVWFTAETRDRCRSIVDELRGSERDPLFVAAKLYTDETVPLGLRASLILGVIQFIYPKLSEQKTTGTMTHVQVKGDALAARTALMLEGDCAGYVDGETLDEVNENVQIGVDLMAAPQLEELLGVQLLPDVPRAERPKVTLADLQREDSAE